MVDQIVKGAAKYKNIGAGTAPVNKYKNNPVRDLR